MAQPEPGLEALLVHLRDTRGFDFSGYKRSSLARRVERRMAEVGITDYADYMDRLELNAEEFTALFNTILINVTTFFRDPDAWDYLSTQVLPDLLATKSPTDPIRVWSAGCSSGEEAYTLAIVLAEHLGIDEFRQRVKIYATDVDEDGLVQARQAVYDERQVQGIPPDLLERYFEQVGNRFGFRKDLRRSVIFGRNDLVQDAPISRIDLLVCRNTLMYFTAETQARTVARFHFAVNPGGALFLGKAEMLLSHGAMFVPMDLKRRVFARVARTEQTSAAAIMNPVSLPAAAQIDTLDRLREITLLTGPVAQIVVTADGYVALVNHQAERLLGISAHDRGRPFRDLDLSYRPVELRRYIEQAQVDRRTVGVGDVVFPDGADGITLEIQISPLVEGDIVLGVTVAFHDVSEARRLQNELKRANAQLETAYEELQSTNEELETTNEELQSTVEELETTNEELQSTNEELETMNEELQSTNDELQSINGELHDRTLQLDEVNVFLEAILASLRAGVVVLGPDMAVRVWNEQAQELWGLRREEAVGQPFLTLDIGLPIDRLRSLMRNALAGGAGPHELVVPAVNRRGRSVDIRVRGSALNSKDDHPAGIILMMEPGAATEPGGLTLEGRPEQARIP